MSKFSYLEVTKPKAGVTREYVMGGISINGANPVLIVSPATKANRKYWREILKIANQNRNSRKKTMNERDLDEISERDMDLYSRTVISGWKNVYDDKGKEVPFSESDCKDFLAAIPDSEFDDLRNYCGEISNFVDVVDVETIAKN